MDVSVADFGAFGFDRVIRYRGIFDFDGLYKFTVA